MKIATLLFTYNRSRHAEAVITALSQNNRKPENLFVFQDGLKDERDLAEWRKVNALIRNIDWCETELILSGYNKGLSVSITEGIAYAFREYDAVVILEDDCVPAAAFMDFMYQCFETYRDNKKVFSVSGYAYPVSLGKREHDVYGCGRISSWGWGTWKDRWEYFEKDYELVKKLKQEEASSRNLAIWGGGLENMLVGNVRGECDSWAVFWALKAIAERGITVIPYKSLIRNIGLDGSGVHCSVMDYYDVTLANGQNGTFDLPDDIEITDETIEAFMPLFGNATAINRDNGLKKRILVYGLGNFYLHNEQEICAEYYVEAFIDRKRHGWFAGKRIIKKEEMEHYTYDKVLLMIQDDQDCQDVERQLLAQQIPSEKIVIGRDIYELCFIK